MDFQQRTSGEGLERKTPGAGCAAGGWEEMREGDQNWAVAKLMMPWAVISPSTVAVASALPKPER